MVSKSINNTEPPRNGQLMVFLESMGDLRKELKQGIENLNIAQKILTANYKEQIDNILINLLYVIFCILSFFFYLIIIVGHAQKEPISMNMNVKFNAQTVLLKKKNQFNHVRIVTKDVLFVKIALITNVVLVMMDTTYMKLHVSLVPHVNKCQDGIRMPQPTCAQNAHTNVTNVQKLMTIVNHVPNQE